MFWPFMIMAPIRAYQCCKRNGDKTRLHSAQLAFHYYEASVCTTMIICNIIQLHPYTRFIQLLANIDTRIVFNIKFHTNKAAKNLMKIMEYYVFFCTSNCTSPIAQKFNSFILTK